ncbi:hypothetical protein Anapl_07280 [Anas platyrhynchos]|uniref:Uncharacterized protein n=1 Tax=Anas platyrhynchos TaxID=8839 RepID=R0JCV0_ANAPL|nr:hypothetical protein Anapl_07280 [Anas platyrhynchos]
MASYSISIWGTLKHCHMHTDKHIQHKPTRCITAPLKLKGQTVLVAVDLFSSCEPCGSTDIMFQHTMSLLVVFLIFVWVAILYQGHSFWDFLSQLWQLTKKQEEAVLLMQTDKPVIWYRPGLEYLVKHRFCKHCCMPSEQQMTQSLAGSPVRTRISHIHPSQQQKHLEEMPVEACHCKVNGFRQLQIRYLEPFGIPGTNCFSALITDFLNMKAVQVKIQQLVPAVEYK